MAGGARLERLWAEAAAAVEVFDPARHLAGLPAPARRYLSHALRPGAPLATAARLAMRGTIRLGGAWWPFEAAQVLRADGAMHWAARARVRGLPLEGFDELVDGRGAMRWRLFGLLPFLRAAGPDVTRSAAGRVVAESFWLPSAFLLDPGVTWAADGEDAVVVTRALCGERVRVRLGLDGAGGVRDVGLERWGDPGGVFAYQAFGGLVEREAAHEGVTLPVEVRVGWHWGTPRFEPEGEFFRAALTEVRFR